MFPCVPPMHKTEKSGLGSRQMCKSAPRCFGATLQKGANPKIQKGPLIPKEGWEGARPVPPRRIGNRPRNQNFRRNEASGKRTSVVLRRRGSPAGHEATAREAKKHIHAAAVPGS